MKKYLIGSLLVASTAFAGGPDTVSPNQPYTHGVAGPYVAGSIGYSDVFASASNYPNVTSTTESAFAWNILVGYQFTPNVALELSYLSFGHANLNTVSSGTGEAELSGMNVDLKGIYPINNRFDVFGTAGVMLVYQSLSGAGLSGSQNAWTPNLGVGMDYLVIDSLSLIVQDIFAFKNTNNNIPAANAILAGLGYKFSW